MEAWKKNLKNDPVPWLLESSDPSIIYYTLIHLLDKNEKDAEVIKNRNLILESQKVKILFANQNEKGYWENPLRYIDDRYKGTFWRVLLLMDLGVEAKHPQILKAVNFLVEAAYNKDADGFVSRQQKPVIVPCYNGDLLWEFLKCGYESHPYVLKCINWLCENMQFNDGDRTVNDPDSGCFGAHTCIRAVFPVLRAFMILPEFLQNEKTEQIIEQCIEFILIHHVYKSSHNLTKSLNPKMTQLTFPNYYYPDLLYALLLLTEKKIKDSRMDDAVNYLIKKQNNEGKWKMQRLYNERSKNDCFPIVVQLEDRGMPSRWITLRVLTVLKRYLS